LGGEVVLKIQPNEKNKNKQTNKQTKKNIEIGNKGIIDREREPRIY